MTKKDEAAVADRKVNPKKLREYVELAVLNRHAYADKLAAQSARRFSRHGWARWTRAERTAAFRAAHICQMDGYLSRSEHAAPQAAMRILDEIAALREARHD